MGDNSRTFGDKTAAHYVCSETRFCGLENSVWAIVRVTSFLRIAVAGPKIQRISEWNRDAAGADDRCADPSDPKRFWVGTTVHRTPPMMSVISPMCTDADGLVQCLHWLTQPRRYGLMSRNRLRVGSGVPRGRGRLMVPRQEDTNRAAQIRLPRRLAAPELACRIEHEGTRHGASG